MGSCAAGGDNWEDGAFRAMRKARCCCSMIVGEDGEGIGPGGEMRPCLAEKRREEETWEDASLLGS